MSCVKSQGHARDRRGFCYHKDCEKCFCCVLSRRIITFVLKSQRAGHPHRCPCPHQDALSSYRVVSLYLYRQLQLKRFRGVKTMCVANFRSKTFCIHLFSPAFDKILIFFLPCQQKNSKVSAPVDNLDGIPTSGGPLKVPAFFKLTWVFLSLTVCPCFQLQTHVRAAPAPTSVSSTSTRPSPAPALTS